MKKPTLFLALLCFCAFGTLKASTSITAGSVSGHWTVSGSPYLIYNNFTVADDSTLVIDPGVDIVFQGYYQITIFGSMSLAGTASAPINFHVQDTTGWSGTGTAGAWNGISSYGTISPMSYCNFYDTKGDGLYLTKPFVASYCNFYHNNSALLNIIASDSLQLCELSNCTFYNNLGNLPGGDIMDFEECYMYMHNCKIYNNVTNNSAITGAYANLEIDSNEIDSNVQLDTSLVATIAIYNATGVFRGNKIHHNTAVIAGSFSLMVGNYDLEGNLICNNRTLVGSLGTSGCGSIEGGGGIRISGEGGLTPSHFLIRNNIFANNYSAFMGGAIYLNFTNAVVVNNNFVNNSSPTGGAIYINNDTTEEGHTNVAIKNNIFKNNGDSSWSLYSLAIDTVSFDHNWCDSNYSGTFASLLAPLAFTGDTTTDIVGTYPGMIAPTLTSSVGEDATTAAFGLLSTSPCIHTGDTSGACIDSVDFAGNPRLTTGGIDIGAYEFDTVITPLNTQAIGNTQAKITISPNPTNGLLEINGCSAGLMVITDISGRPVATCQASNGTTHMDVSALPAGVYLLSQNGGSLPFVAKFIKY